MEFHLKVIGALLVVLAFIHVIFPRYFHWKKELSLLSLINRQMMTIHTFFIALMVFLVGLLCLTSAEDLIGTTLGKKISLGLCFFWAIRLYVQVFGYSSNLWKGKIFESIVHVAFLILWTYMSLVFGAVYFLY